MKLLFFLLLPIFCFGQGLIVNEISNGDSGTKEYFELVVIGSSTNPTGFVDLGGWIIDDNNGDFEGTSTTGIATGHIRINPGYLSSVKPGSIILIYNSAELSFIDDPNDANNDLVYIIPIDDISLDNNNTNPSTTNSSYNLSVYGALKSWVRIGLRNSGDVGQVRKPDGTFFHGFSYGDVLNPFPTFPIEFGGGNSFNVRTGSGTDRNYNFSWEVEATGTNRTSYINNLIQLNDETNISFAKGDLYLTLGRLTNNDSLICKSVDIYEKIYPNDLEEKALLFETIASIDCGKDARSYLLRASKIWNQLGNRFRSELDEKIALGEPIEFELSLYPIPEVEKKTDNREIIIGDSYFILDKSDILVSQTDRVTRDWLTYQFKSPYNDELLTIFSEKLRPDFNDTELFPEIGWHEGARIKELKQSGLTHKISSGTVAVKINELWYAPDENGIFRFEVPLDKIMYPTTRFLRDDIAVLIDTHGINMLVEQAVRYKATAVIGCCDHIGKIRAAKYLSDKGVKVICPTDKYVPLLLFSDANVLGSPPILKEGNSFILGRRPIEISKNQKIVVMNSTNSPYAVWYYQTPALYFLILEKLIDLDIDYVQINGFGQMSKVIDKAEENSADIIAVRVFDSDDYFAVKRWLEKDKNHKAILFHSISYPRGYQLLEEFPEQTSFDDINPTIA